MANPAQHVTRTRAAIARLTDAFEAVQGCLGEYRSLGGAPAIAGHWTTPAGQPRTDLDITAQQYTDALASVEAIATVVAQGHATNLYRAKG